MKKSKMSTEKLLSKIIGKKVENVDRSDVSDMEVKLESGATLVIPRKEYFDIFKEYIKQEGYGFLVKMFEKGETSYIIEMAKRVYKHKKRIKKQQQKRFKVHPSEPRETDQASQESDLTESQALNIINLDEISPYKYVGTVLDQAVEEMKKIAIRDNAIVSITWNGVEVNVGPDSEVDNVVKHWEDQQRAKQLAYEQSDEYKANQEKQQKEVEALQRTADLLVEELKTLDFSNLQLVLNWLCAIQEPGDRIGVTTDRELIIKTFNDNGYFENVNIGNDFNGEDRENFARYIIGQGLDGISRMGAPHQVIYRFVDQWKEKFPA